MHTIGTFYRFERLEAPDAVAVRLRTAGETHNVCGLILVGRQGINATVAVPDEASLEDFICRVEDVAGFVFDNVKRSRSDRRPFRRFRVRVEQELITFGQPAANPIEAPVGTYISPREWNAVIERDDVVLVDTRNDYETKTGTFEGALDPNIASFSEFAAFVEKRLSPEQTPRVAMYCTGGIRCEVASSYLLQKGFAEVFHLKGGILKYLEEVPAQESKWQGECFVFDDRVTVDHALQPGAYTLCLACSWPTPTAHFESGKYAGGAACAHCVDTLSEQHLARAKERLRQRRLRSS